MSIEQVASRKIQNVRLSECATFFKSQADIFRDRHLAGPLRGGEKKNHFTELDDRLTEQDGAAFDSSSSAYPTFSAFHRSKPEGIALLPVRKNHIEQNFYITKKNQRGGSASDVDCIFAFCFNPFRSFTTTKIRVHLTGESQGEVRVAACKYVPDACKQFYLAEREREAAAARERAAQKNQRA
jgi:hypothetical protein